MLKQLISVTGKYIWKNSIKLKTCKCLSTALVFLLLYASIFGFMAPVQPVLAGGSLTAEQMAEKAVDFINVKYQAGENIDGYAAYALKLAGENLAAPKWTGNSDFKTLKSKIEELAGLLGDSNSLIAFISATQNADGSFGPYANEYGAKAPLQALAAVRTDTAGTALEAITSESISQAIDYFKNGYQDGSMSYVADGWKFDYRCVEALVAAGEDLSSEDWATDGVSLKSRVIASAAATVADLAEKNAPHLAKELTALHAVDPASGNIATLRQAIAALQDSAGSFGGSIYDHVMVLTALGKAGGLAGIDQNAALSYLNTFKIPHTDSWGSPAGAAWGGYGQKEPDLTAQALTALSYFSGAGDPASGVYGAIQDGLTYLADIQDQDTAAIPAQYDSTFATAETLLALKSLGFTYNEYAGISSPWVKKSKTKTIALCLLALSQWGDDGAVLRDSLAGLLAGRQRTSDPGKGSFEDSVYSDMWAYLALGEAGKIDSLDISDARDYILSKQGVDGSWGETWWGVYYPDFISTTQAIRALTYLPGAAADQQVQEAIELGLVYLKGLQQPDGGVYDPWDDPVVDNSELIVTVKRLGLDPAGAGWTNDAGLTPVYFLMNGSLNDDGSFGSSRNVLGAANALAAYLVVGGQAGPGGPGGGGQTPPAQDAYQVNIAVVGKDGELLYGPGRVTVSAGGAWGRTAMGALHATGLNYVEDNGFVKSIGGQANAGMQGWMYKVNGAVPVVMAKDRQVYSNDRIIWWYSTDPNSMGPDWDSLVQGARPALVEETKKPEEFMLVLQLSRELIDVLDKLEQLLGLNKDLVTLVPLGEAVKTIVLTVSDNPMSLAQRSSLKKELVSNAVDLSQKVEIKKGAIIADTKREVALFIPPGALKNNVVITVKKIDATGAGDAPGAKAPVNYRMVSPAYSFGPDGTKFETPVTLALKVALPPLTRPENLSLAWYDRAGKKWMAIPAVMDLSKGLVLAKVNHFSEYAVLAREERKTFADVNPDKHGWARDAVEILAGAGVIAGVDGKNYQPDRAITRAEMARILVQALELPKEEGGTTFGDVPESRWYTAYVAAASKAGLLKGYEDGSFCPERNISREELAAVLARVLKLKDPSGPGVVYTDSSEVSDWARNSVAAAFAAGLVSGYPDGTFKPKRDVTRAECAAMVYRALINY